MQRLLLAGVVIGIVISSGLPNLNAAYLIKLKNGKEYLTSRYWHERGQLFFDTHGGIFGIDRSFVSKIEHSNQIVSIPLRSTSTGTGQEISSAPIERELKTQASSEKETTRTKATQAEARQEPLKKDEEILKKYEELQQRFGQLNDLPKHEVHALEADIQSFREKISKGELAEAHKEENAAMGTLLRAIASFLKASYP